MDDPIFATLTMALDLIIVGDTSSSNSSPRHSSDVVILDDTCPADDTDLAGNPFASSNVVDADDTSPTELESLGGDPAPFVPIPYSHFDRSLFSASRQRDITEVAKQSQLCLLRERFGMTQAPFCNLDLHL